MRYFRVLYSLLFLTVHCRSEVPDSVRYVYACDYFGGTSYTFECSLGEFWGERHARIETLFEKRSLDEGQRIRNLWMRCKFGTIGGKAGPSLFDESELFWRQTTNGVFSGDSLIEKGETNRVRFSASRIFLRRQNKPEYSKFNLQTNCPESVLSDIQGFAEEMSGARLKTRMSVSSDWGDAVYCQHSVDPESPVNVKFQDLYFTPLRYLRCAVRCKGIVARIDMKAKAAVLWPSWSLDDWRPGGSPVHGLLRGNFSVPLHFLESGHDGGLDPILKWQVVEVEGRVSSVDGPGDVWGDLAGVGARLECCRIVKTPENVGGSQRAPYCKFVAPCREFKLRIQIGKSKYYLVHCYGSSLRLAPIDDCSRQMLPLYGTRRDEESMLKIWSLLRKVEEILTKCFKKDPCFDGCACVARDFSEIPDLQLSKDECPGLIPIVEALSALVNNDEQ